MQFLRQLEPFNNVVATGRAVCSSKLVLGNVVERVVLELGGTTFTKAMISAIRVRLNGKVVFGDVSGTHLDAIQKYLTLANDTTRLTIDFTEPVARNVQGQLMGGIDTVACGVTDFTIEVDIASATAPTLAGYVQMRTSESLYGAGFTDVTRPVIRALIPTSIPVTAAGEIQASVNIGSAGESLIKRYFIYSTILSGFRLKKDSVDVFGSNALSKGIVDYVAQEYGRQLQSNLYVYDPLADGNQIDAVSTRRADGNPANFQNLFTATGAGTHYVYADVYTTLPRL